MRANWVPGQRLPLVGRESHLEVLLAVVAAAERAEATLGLLGGEGGAGKTRLARELAARVSAPSLWATCWEGEGRPPSWPWVQVLRALARLPQRPGGPAPAS